PAVAEALRVPIRYKSHGRLEAAMIARVDHRLASYRSDSRTSFLSGPTILETARDYTTLLGPGFVRRMTYSVKQRLMPRENTFANWFHKFGISSLGDWSQTRQLIEPELISDEEQLNRAATLQFLCERLRVGALATSTL